MNNERFEVGDTVYSSQFGEGIVFSVKPPKLEVRFRQDDGFKDGVFDFSQVSKIPPR